MRLLPGEPTERSRRITYQSSLSERTNTREERGQRLCLGDDQDLDHGAPPTDSRLLEEALVERRHLYQDYMKNYNMQFKRERVCVDRFVGHVLS